MHFLRGQRVKLTEIFNQQNPVAFSVTIEITDPTNALYDIACFGVDEHGKCSDDRFFIFYNQKHSPCHSIVLTDTEEPNQECININLAGLPKTIKKLLLTATIDGQGNMSQLDTGSLVISQRQNNLGQFSFKGSDFEKEKSLLIGEFYFKDEWRFSAIGQGFNGGLSALLSYFGIEEAQTTTVVSAEPNTNASQAENQVLEKKGIPAFLKSIFNIPFKNSDNKKNLRQFQALLGDYLADGVLTHDEMANLSKFCVQHNMHLQEALAQSSQTIAIFLRGMLADIVADNDVSEEEENIIKSACHFLNPPASLMSEIDTTLQRMKLIKKIKSGDTPSMQNTSVITKIGESIWHYTSEITLIREQSRETKRHQGHIIVTSERIIFKSLDYPVEIPLNNIIDVEPRTSALYIVGKTKKTTCQFNLNDGEILGAYIEQALNKFHRKINLKETAKKTRSIPQSVKQAVWLRDAGQCVECNATEYLEFDHIIPFSKGGSNSENNIQLLCRKCNLKKSDRI